MSARPRLIGFDARALAVSVSIHDLARSPTVPWRVKLQVHPSLPSLPFRVPSFQLPLAAFRRRAFLPRFLPSSRHHWRRSLNARLARPSLRSVHRLSQPLDGLLRLPASRAYFIPQPRSGFITVQGLLPLCSRTFLIERPCLHVVAALSLTARRPLPRSGTSTSRRSSAQRYVPRVRWLTSPSVAPLFGFHPPPGTPYSSSAPVTQRLSLMGLILSAC